VSKTANASAAARGAPDDAVLVAVRAPPEPGAAAAAAAVLVRRVFFIVVPVFVVHVHLAAARARLAEHEPHVAAGLARAGVARGRRALAPGQPRRELPGLVQPLQLLGVAHELPVHEQAGEGGRGRRPALGERASARDAEEAVELVPEAAVHGHVALVEAHAVALEDGAREAAVLVRGAHAAQRREVEHRPARGRLLLARLPFAAVRRDGGVRLGQRQRRDLGERGEILRRRGDREREGVAPERCSEQRRVVLQARHERPRVDVLGLVGRRHGGRARRQPRRRARHGGLRRPRQGLLELEGAQRGRREPDHVDAGVAGAPGGERLAPRQRQRRRAVPEVVPGLPGGGAPHGACEQGQRQRLTGNARELVIWIGIPGCQCDH
jgi:hypothetical protein